MTVLLTLTTADADTGPFDLYSNLDAYVTPFELGVSKAALQAGYTTTLVPNNTIIVRAKSTGHCINYIDITLVPLPNIACGATVNSTPGITNKTFSLDPAGGILILGVDASGIPDKFEIIHNGVKKATSAMITANAGPFDDVYGTPPSNVIPTEVQTGPVTQFIGSDKGSVPNRNAAFATENPTLSYIVAAPQQQLVWWKYTPADALLNSQAIIRVTSPSTLTSWNFVRKCATTTTTTTIAT